MTAAGLTGPLAGDLKGWPFGRPNLDLAAHGYREDEFFLTGTATRYQPRSATDLGQDGRWLVDPVEATEFKTRLVVYRGAGGRGL